MALAAIYPFLVTPMGVVWNPCAVIFLIPVFAIVNYTLSVAREMQEHVIARLYFFSNVME